jgi:Fe-S cluster biosynthesis and repair protein YggX
LSEVNCARCGNTSPGLDRAPLPGDVGEQVHAKVCASCWQEWLETQVRVINEYQLSPADPKHFEYIVGQMKAFLSLG